MIPKSAHDVETFDWQSQLKHAFRNPRALLTYLNLDPQRLPQPLADQSDFSFLVTRSFADRMSGQADCPLLRQVLPLALEDEATPGFTYDPLQERSANPTPGLLHKFKDRALLTLTGGCAIHCRYCFRRHFPYQANTPPRTQWQAAFDYIIQDTNIREIIFSGGDPMILNDAHLGFFIKAVSEIPHVRRIRLHTRLPIVLPARITQGLLQVLTGQATQTVVVIHCNHPQEINPEVGQSLVALREAGIPLLNQSVLLAGVNDHVDVLDALSEQLFAYQVMPYYLHLLDPVAGSAHFSVPLQRAQALQNELRAKTAGYLMPQFVFEEPGQPSKIPL